MKQGLLLINIGSPNAPITSSVRQFLREFLSDKRVIDLPAPLRYLLLYGVILPQRPRRAAALYRAIWTDSGSPLIACSKTLCATLQARLGDEYKVILAMRYGLPSLDDAIAALHDCEHITVLPLYPQYSSAATGSSIEYVLKALSSKEIIPSLKIIRDFYQHPAYIKAQAAQIKPYIKDHDHVLYSYHGVPERHLLKGGCTSICTKACPPASANNGCYRAQCLQTSSIISQVLDLKFYSTSFQSRLGRTPWIKPYTDNMLTTLASQGIKRLAVACPSFVTDCLETLEEINIRAKEQWQQLGGDTLTLIPCMNNNDTWIDAIISIAQLS